MFAWLATTNTTVAHALDVVQKCNVLISKNLMTLDDLRKKVLYQNTLDVWIGICEEKNLNWNETESYKKFIDYLLNQKIGMKKFPLCVSESDSTLDSAQNKIKFAEALSASNDPNCATYTVRLNSSAIELIRNFNLQN